MSTAPKTPTRAASVDGMAHSFYEQYESSILSIMQELLDEHTTPVTPATVAATAGVTRLIAKTRRQAQIARFLAYDGHVWVSGGWLARYRDLSASYMFSAVDGEYPQDLIAGEWFKAGNRLHFEVNAMNRMGAARRAINMLLERIGGARQPYKVFDFIAPSDIETIYMWDGDLY